MPRPSGDHEPSVTAGPSSAAEPTSAAATSRTAPAHYFDASPRTGSRPATVRLDLPDRSIELHTDRGVFSPDRIDPGTKLLLQELPELGWGPVLDLGCGYGPIACTVALRQPSLEVVAVDVNERARELCTRNAASLGAHVTVLDPAAAERRLGAVGTIVSNPPIRIGKAALHTLLSTWLDRLAEGGAAHLVVHKHLGADSLARWLAERGHQVERRRSRQGYRVLQVSAR